MLQGAAGGPGANDQRESSKQLTAIQLETARKAHLFRYSSSGEGLLIATVNALAAGTSRPLRSLAVMNGGLAIAASSAYLLSARLLPAFGHQGRWIERGAGRPSC
jgi:hypothetical protein